MKNVRIPAENICFKIIRKSLISLVVLCFCFRILLSKVVVNLDVFLPIEESSVASFCESRALIPRKFMTEQGIRVPN